MISATDEIPMWLKRRITDSLFRRNNIWSRNTDPLKTTAVAQVSMERAMLKITRRDKMRNDVIRFKTEVKDIKERVRKMRGQWSGHLARMSNIKWAMKATDWSPTEGKRGRGRAKRRWQDDIEEVGGTT